MPRPAGVREPSVAVDRGQQAASRPDEANLEPREDATALRPESAGHLQRAIVNGEFSPHFQPIVSLESGELLAAEVLARWQPSPEDVVPPSSFIGLAEESGLIRRLGRRMLDATAGLMEEWGEGAPPRIHLNFSPAELTGDAPLLSELERASREHDVHLGRLCVEVSERQAEVSPETVRELRHLGVQVALDDFGSGYSSYALLGTLPITDLKLDGSLIRPLESGSRPRAVVKRIVDLARDLGLRVVAEGVQTSRQLDHLREAGCRVGQGFLFGRPQAPKDFEEMLLGSSRHRPNGSSE